MILQALVEYYQRKGRDDASALPPPGFERKELPFVVVLDRRGGFIDLEDTRTGEGRSRRGRQFTVPQAIKRTADIAANLLWDNVGYVFGVDAKGKPERARAQQQAFTAAIRERVPDAAEDEGVRAVLEFLERADFARLQVHPLWTELVESGASVSFRLQGESELVCQRPAVRKAVDASNRQMRDGATTCLVTGELDMPARLHPALKGIPGAQTSGASLVSFNLQAFDSYGRKQGANAPVGERATFAYTTALKYLLRRESRQKLQLGDATTVFWAREQHPLEDMLADLLGEPPRDDPNRNTEALRTLLSAPRTGALGPADDPTPFYVLGLSPNAARVAVRFWWTGTAGHVAASIRQHFDDLRIARAPHDPETLSVFRLLVATATLGKADNIRPNLAGAFVRSILENRPYPRELLSAAVTRIRAEREVTYARASLIKAWLLRVARRSEITPTLEVSVSLDERNPDAAYRLGRLFAALERLQEAANPGLNATIRDRYFGAASATPVVAFPRLIKLSNHHLSKLESAGLRVFYEKLIGEIVDAVHEFPPLLSLEQQGLFSIGYYHQRQAFFKPRLPDSDDGDGASAA